MSVELYDLMVGIALQAAAWTISPMLEGSALVKPGALTNVAA